METFICESVNNFNTKEVNIDYQCLVLDVLRHRPHFLIYTGTKVGPYATQNKRVRGWVMRVCAKYRLTIGAPTHFAQNAQENVEVYQDAVAYANTMIAQR